VASNIITLVVQADTAGANQQIVSVNKSLSGFERQALASGSNASRSFLGFERAASRAAVSIENRFSVLRGVLGANALQGILGQSQGLVAAGVQIAGSFERSKIGLEAFLGSAEKAQAILGDLQDFAAKSPFQFKDIAQGANRLLAFNFESQKLLPTLSAVSSATGALGGDVGKFNDLITALGQIRQASRLTGEDLRQLRNAGVESIVLEGLATAFNKSAAEIQKAIRDGLIPGTVAAEVAVKSLEARFGKFNDKVAQSFEVSVSNIGDSLGKLADKGIGPLLPKITQFLNGLKPSFDAFAGALARNSGNIESWIKTLAQVGVAIGVAQIPLLVRNISTSLVGLSAALASNPFGLAAAGLGVLAFGLIRVKQAADDLDAKFAQLDVQAYINEQAKAGKSFEEIAVGAESLKEKLGLSFLPTDSFDGLKASVEGVKVALKDTGIYTSSFKLPQGLDLGIKVVDGAERKLKLQGASEEAAKRVADAEKAASKILQEAQEKSVQGIQRVGIELRNNLREYGLTAKAVGDLKQAAALESLAILRKQAEEGGKDALKDVADRESAEKKLLRDLTADRARSNLEASVAALDSVTQTQDAIAEQEIRSLELRRDRQLAELDVVAAKTIDAQISIEERKAKIEQDFVLRSTDLRYSLFKRQVLRELALDEEKYNKKELSEASFQAKVEAADLKLLQRRAQLGEDADAAVAAAGSKARIAASRLAVDSAQQSFEDLKRSVGGVFDQLVTKSNDIFSAIGNIAKTALLSAIKEVVTSRIASQLLGLIGGSRSPQLSGGGFGGGLLRQAGLGGSLGAFGVAGAPGGTSGFGGPVSAANLGPGAYGNLPQIIGVNGQPINIGGGRGGGLGSLALGGAGLSSLFFNKGIIELGGGIGKTAGAIGGLQGGLAGVASSTAGLLGGGLLAFQGVKQGGFLGSLLAAGGGALAGFALGAKIGSIGGPVGALIGAAVGGSAALIRSLFKSGAEKAREKIKSIYGVDISAKNILDQIVGMAKQSYGGNLDVAVRSKDVHDLVELYALSTGQSARGLTPQIQPATLSTSGGVTSILANYQNGRSVGAGAPSGDSGTVIQLTLDGPSSAAFLQGQTVNAIEANPRTVAAATNTAQQSNFNRQQSAVNQFSPGLLLS
jgi:tape measure domain-containing protein